MEVDVKERALIPAPCLDEAPCPLEARIQRRAGKRRLHGDLDIVELGALDEVIDGVKDLLGVPIQPQDETAVDGNPVRLDAGNGGFIGGQLLEFPIPAL